MANEIKVPDYDGRKTFDFILEQIENCIIDIRPFFYNVNNFNAEILYNKEFLKRNHLFLYERPEIDLIEMAMCDIAYAIVFIGVSWFDLSALTRIYIKKYNPVFIQTLFPYISFKPHPDSNFDHVWIEFKEHHLQSILANLSTDLQDKSQVPKTHISNMFSWFTDNRLNQKKYFRDYGGHQFKLGHYYRHLFQSVKYIDGQKKLSYSEKYEYLKTLRAQLSTPEQYLLFFNTISSLGRAWEFDHIDSQTPFQNFNCYLITKYNFIKNVPDTLFINLIEMKKYYPLVHFEFDDLTKDRIALEKKFR
jgi:hypothetical protein